MTGSSNLTGDQQDWYLKRFGVRYVAVQEAPLRMTRKQRRKLRFKPKAEQ